MTTPVPIACSLEGAELDARGESIRELGSSLLGVDADRASARLRFDADKHPELEDFVRAESSCCSFFAFDLATENGVSQLTINAPEDAGWAVRGLVAGFVAGWENLV